MIHRLRMLLLLVVACAISFSTVARKSNPHRSTPHRAPQHRGQAFAGDVVSGRVVSIADGDTLTVLDEANTQHRIRLFGIDAPEKGQAHGRQSKESLADKVYGETVRVDVVDVDRYGREVGRIYLGDRFINLEQVQEGDAWRYPQFDREHEFSAAERNAREQRLGLWTESHPIPPWEFRRQHRLEGDARGRQAGQLDSRKRSYD